MAIQLSFYIGEKTKLDYLKKLITMTANMCY